MVYTCRTLRFLILLAGCQRSAPPGARAPYRFETGTLRPLRLIYGGEHRGDHRPWRYRAHVSIEEDTRDGQRAWRHTYWIEDEDPPAAQFEATTALHRDNLALLEGVEIYGGSFGDSRTRLALRGDRLVGESVAVGERTAIDIGTEELTSREAR